MINDGAVRSLRLAPDAVLALFLVVLFLLAALLARVQVLLVEVLQHLVVGVSRARIDLAWQSCGEDLYLFCGQIASLRHRHLELDDKVSPQLLAFEEWHSKPSDDLLAVVAHYFASPSVDGVLPAVEMGQLKAKAKQGLSQADGLFVEEVCAFAGEVGVRDFLDDEQKVSSRCLWLC